MVTLQDRGIWAKLEGLRRFKRAVRSLGDVFLAVQIGLFVLLAPIELQRKNLGRYLADHERRRELARNDLSSDVRRIVRIRRAWLKLGCLRSHDTCYVRALTLHRFLPAGHGAVKIHFGVEPSVGRNGRLHGHAWVTVGGVIVEGPDEARAGRLHEIGIWS